MTTKRCWLPWLVAALAVAAALTLAVVLVQRDREAKAEKREAAANDAAAKAAFPRIQERIILWTISGGDTYPPASEVTGGALASWSEAGLPPWPTNPFTGEPMKPGRNPGDYEFLVLDGVEKGDSAWTSRYMLQGYGSGGAVLYRLIVPPPDKRGH